MNVLKLILAMVGASVFAVGCAAEVSQPVSQTGVDSTEATATEESDLSISRLIGTWEATTGPIYSIEFTGKVAQTLGGGLHGHRFTARIDTGIRCITTPCPSETEVSGVYKSVGNKLTLASYDRPSAEFARILGEYKHSLSNGDKNLKVDKADGTIHQAFTRNVGVPCGTTTCGAGLYCCNPLRNMCARPGMFCIQ